MDEELLDIVWEKERNLQVEQEGVDWQFDTIESAEGRQEGSRSLSSLLNRESRQMPLMEKR